MYCSAGILTPEDVAGGRPSLRRGQWAAFAESSRVVREIPPRMGSRRADKDLLPAASALWIDDIYAFMQAVGMVGRSHGGTASAVSINTPGCENYDASWRK